VRYLFFVMGATNVGKSTFLNNVKTAYPDYTYLIQVGKIFRQRYSPDYFEGQAAPVKTQEEAIEILFSEYAKATEYPFVLIDGQPRDLNQSKLLQNTPKFEDRRCLVFHLVAPRIIREARARGRDTGKALELSLARLDDDVLKLHEILIDFTRFDRYTINTEKENPLDVFRTII
jgi:adenylate kinase family enzyme